MHAEHRNVCLYLVPKISVCAFDSTIIPFFFYFISILNMHVVVLMGNKCKVHCVAGTGKTTTLALLTGRAHVSGGDALVNGVSVMGEAEPASRALLGFCPQQDPLLELLTAREHLSLFARLKARPQPLNPPSDVPLSGPRPLIHPAIYP